MKFKYLLMKEKKLNCKNAKKICISNYLQKLGEKPKREFKSYGMYRAFWRNEKSASVKIDYNLNMFYDFGTSESGDIINLVQLINKCNVSNALKILESNTFSFHQQPKTLSIKPAYSIKKVTELTNQNLLNYLTDRKINLLFAKQFCFQVHYSFSDEKEYYAIGFMNNSGGLELRNKFFKGCLGKKEITTINNNSNSVSLFESWSDFLSYLTLKKEIPKENFIILNSTSMIKKTIELLSGYSLVKVFFDNDEAGDKATKLLLENTKNKFSDNRIHYKNYNDFNEFLMKSPNVYS